MTRSVPRQLAILGLFVIAFALVAVEIRERQRGVQAYPGLYLPSFEGVPQSGHTAVGTEPVVTATLADGAKVTLDAGRVLGKQAVLKSVVLDHTFADPGRMNDPRTRAWLARRIEAVDGHRPATAARIDWRNVAFDLRTGARRVGKTVQTIDVDLSGA